MFNLENFLAIHKKNYNDTPSLMATGEDELKLFDRLQFNFVFPDPDIIALSDTALEHLKNTPKFLRDWQADDMRTNTVYGYYKNPVKDSMDLISASIADLLIQLTVVEEGTGRRVALEGFERIVEELNRSQTVSGNFLDHTNRLSNVVPVYPNPERPHYLTCMAANRVLEYIIYQTDTKEDTETILSCFTALFVGGAIAELAATYAELSRLIDQYRSPMSNIINWILVPDGVRSEIIDLLTFLIESSNFMESRVQHDYRVWENIKKLLDEYNIFRVMQNMGDTQKKLVQGYIGTEKLLTSLQLEDLPPTKWSVDIDYYGNTRYTIVPDTTVLPPNTTMTIVDDYIEYYNVANLEVILVPPYRDYVLDVDPGALIFNTFNGIWSNTRTVRITNTGNSTYIYSNVEFRNFSTSEFRYDLHPANTNLLRPANTLILNVAARGMSTGNTVDYGIITIVPGVNIQTKVYSNTANSLAPAGILLPSQIVKRFGSETNPLIINANNGPFPILAESTEESYDYTWKNMSEYPVTISTIENVTDPANTSDLTITLFGANTAQTLNIGAGITLNTSESVLWYANVIPHLDSPNTSIFKVTTLDGQERLMYLGVFGGDNGVTPGGPGGGGGGTEPPGGGVDDSTSYNEQIYTIPDIIATNSNFQLIFSSGKPYSNVSYYGPNINETIKLDQNGSHTVPSLNITSNGYYTYVVNFIDTNHTRSITKAIFAS